MKAKAVKIAIPFSESAACKRPQAFVGENCWSDCQSYLTQLAVRGPNLGYDKTDVVVSFDDGHEYAARLDITRLGGGRNNDHQLASHIRSFCRFYGGLHTAATLPSHISPEQYAAILSQHSNDERQYFATFMDKYEIPD